LRRISRLKYPPRITAEVAPTDSYTHSIFGVVYWDSHPPREVTAHDFVRAFKLLGNPVAPVDRPGYYTGTILGLEGYYSRFSQAPGTIPAIQEFVNTHEIEGVRAADDFTLVFRLLYPAQDFLSLLAQPCTAPAPHEYLDYQPDSPEFRQHTLSIGPYRVTRYIQNREMLLERNPVWDQATDPIRPGYVDRIHFRFGIDTQLQQLSILAGTADMGSEMVPTTELASRLAINDPTVLLAPPGDSPSFYRYLDINNVGSKTRSATSLLQVRRAIALAVDKAALVQLVGGPHVARPVRQAVHSSVSDHRKGADQYVTHRDRGNPVEARALLAAAGYPNKISLRLAYVAAGEAPLLAQAPQASLGRAGIDIEMLPKTFSDFYGRLLANPENARRGE
jgi:ABC-type transport system substrate-binding protein